MTPHTLAQLCALGGVSLASVLPIILVPKLLELGTAGPDYRGLLVLTATSLMIGLWGWTRYWLRGWSPATAAAPKVRRALHDYPVWLSRVLVASALFSGVLTWWFVRSYDAGTGVIAGLITFLLFASPVVGVDLLTRRVLRPFVAGPLGAEPITGRRHSVRLRLAFALQLPVMTCAVGIVMIEQSAGGRYEQALRDDNRTRYVYLLDRMLRDLDPSTRAEVEATLSAPPGVRWSADRWLAVPAEDDRALGLWLPPLIGLALVLALAAAFGRWLASQITSELVALEQALAELLSGDLDAAGAVRPERPFGLREPADLFDAFARARTGFARQRAAIREAAHRRRAAEQAKARFLAHLSHELKSPLNSILGFSELMLAGIDGPITEHQRQRLALVWRSGESLLRFILVLLDLARLEVPIGGERASSRRPTGLEPVQTTVGALAKAMDGLVRLDPTGATAVHIEADPLARERAIVVDLPHTARAILALAGTLVDAVELGLVTIRLEADAAGDALIEVSVEVFEAEEADRSRLLQRLDAPYDTLPGLATKRFSAPGAALMLVGWVLAAQGGGVEVVRTHWPRFVLRLPAFTPARASSTGAA